MAKILVADDERGLLDLMERVLGRRGHEVETFAEGESAVEAIEANEYDLVITDLRMPGKNGLEVLAAAKRRRQDLPVILVSGSTEPEDRARAEALGVYMMLHKPVDLAYLVTIINSALEAGGAATGKGSGTGTGTGTKLLPLVRVVEREACLANMIAYCLKKQGLRATTGLSEGKAAVVIAGEPKAVGPARKEAPGAVIIALYPDGSAVDAVRALDLGADVALARPFDPEVLFAHVRAAVRRQQLVPVPVPVPERRAAPTAPPSSARSSDAPITRNRLAAVVN